MVSLNIYKGQNLGIKQKIKNYTPYICKLDLVCLVLYKRRTCNPITSLCLDSCAKTETGLFVSKKPKNQKKLISILL